MVKVGPKVEKKGFLRKMWDGLRSSNQKSDGPRGKTPAPKKPPTANAGHLRAVPPNQLVRLYGTADKGDYNGAFKYAWKFVSESRGAALEKANTRNPHFTPSAEGKYELQFVVNVGEEAKFFLVLAVCGQM